MFGKTAPPLVLAASMVLGVAVTSTPAHADLCASTTDCTLHFVQGNGGSGFGSGDFGTLHLGLSGTTVTVTIDLADGFFLINTGFPGTAGFVDDLGGGLTINNFSSAAYSGSLSDATNDLHYDGFGFANNAAATTGPSGGDATKVNVLSFDVSKATLDDVEDLLNLFNPAGGDGASYFVADVINTNTSGAGAGKTGLISVTGAPPPPPHINVGEPATLAALGSGMLLMGFTTSFLRRRRED